MIEALFQSLHTLCERWIKRLLAPTSEQLDLAKQSKLKEVLRGPGHRRDVVREQIYLRLEVFAHLLTLISHVANLNGSLWP